MCYSVHDLFEHVDTLLFLNVLFIWFANLGFGPNERFCYHWVETFAGGLLVPEDIICAAVSVSAQT